MLQRRGYKVLITRAATPPELQEQVHDSVLVKTVTKFSSIQRVYGKLANRVFDIDTAQRDAGNHAMAPAEVRSPSTDIPEDVTKLTRWDSGEVSIVINTRTILISCKRLVTDDTQLPTLSGAQGGDT